MWVFTVRDTRIPYPLGLLELRGEWEPEFLQQASSSLWQEPSCSGSWTKLHQSCRSLHFSSEASAWGTGRKQGQNILCLWYIQSLFTLTFFGAPFWLQRTALLVGNLLTSCGLMFSRSANNTEGGEFIDINRQMNQNSLFLFILLPQRKDKNRTQHNCANMEDYTDIGEISVHHSMSPRIRQRVSI